MEISVLQGLSPALDGLFSRSFGGSTTAIDHNFLAVSGLQGLVLLLMDLHIFAVHLVEMLLEVFGRSHLPLEPGVGFDLLQGVALLRICHQHSSDQVLRLTAEVALVLSKYSRWVGTELTIISVSRGVE